MQVNSESSRRGIFVGVRTKWYSLVCVGPRFLLALYVLLAPNSVREDGNSDVCGLNGQFLFYDRFSQTIINNSVHFPQC